VTGRPIAATSRSAAEPVASSSTIPTPSAKTRQRIVPADSSSQAQASRWISGPRGTSSASISAGCPYWRSSNGGAAFGSASIQAPSASAAVAT